LKQKKAHATNMEVQGLEGVVLSRGDSQMTVPLIQDSAGCIPVRIEGIY